MSKRQIITGLAIVFIAGGVSSFSCFSWAYAQEKPSSLSEIIKSGEPQIDEEAAEIVKEDQGKENYEILLEGNNHCRSLPENLWVFLLGAYLFLIIFNLSFEFEKAGNIRWFWESLYTVLALLAWFNYDGCRTNTWFAPAVIESGIIIYAYYLYYFKRANRKKKIESSQEEKTAHLPFE